ncbi:MAG: hypothetical protein WCJ35_13125 [Planctomycetota bacterium]
MSEDIDNDAKLLRACGLPAEPAADVREYFDMAVRLIRIKSDYGPSPVTRAVALAAVALAEAVIRAGGQSVESLPFGYEGPRKKHESWLRREDLTRWLAQLGGLITSDSLMPLRPGGWWNMP